MSNRHGSVKVLKNVDFILPAHHVTTPAHHTHNIFHLGKTVQVSWYNWGWTILIRWLSLGGAFFRQSRFEHHVSSIWELVCVHWKRNFLRELWVEYYIYIVRYPEILLQQQLYKVDGELICWIVQNKSGKYLNS